MYKIVDIWLSLFHCIRSSKISDKIKDARIDEASSVKKDYEKKFKKQEYEYNRDLKNIQDEYNSSLESRRNFYEKELELAEKQRVIDIDKKCREIEDLKIEIKKMTATYEEANHKIRSTQLLMSDIKTYLENINKRDIEESRGYKILEQRLHYIETGLAETKFLDQEIIKKRKVTND